MEAIASRLEAIPLTLEAMAPRLEAIALLVGCQAVGDGGGSYCRTMRPSPGFRPPSEPRPVVTSSFLFLVVMPGATSSSFFFEEIQYSNNKDMTHPDFCIWCWAASGAARDAKSIFQCTIRQVICFAYVMLPAPLPC